MSEVRKPYVKLWAAEALLSDNLADLSDHEERIYWRLLMVASLEEERWFTHETPGLHRKCCTTSAKFARAVTKFISFGMVERTDDGRIFIVNGPKWNEATDRKRAPSDSPEATRERQSRHRETRRHEDVTSRDIAVSRGHIEKEKEKEKEEEKEEERAGARVPTAGAAGDDLPIEAREIRDLVLSRLPTKFQRDALVWEEATQFGQDFAGMHTEVCTAIEECRRTPESKGGGVLPFPQRLRRYLPPPTATVQRFVESGLFSPTGVYVGKPVWEDEADAAAQSPAPQVAS